MHSEPVRSLVRGNRSSSRLRGHRGDGLGHRVEIRGGGVLEEGARQRGGHAVHAGRRNEALRVFEDDLDALLEVEQELIRILRRRQRQSQVHARRVLAGGQFPAKLFLHAVCQGVAADALLGCRERHHAHLGLADELHALHLPHALADLPAGADDLPCGLHVAGHAELAHARPGGRHGAAGAGARHRGRGVDASRPLRQVAVHVVP
mmetsp:Transcript_171002/g.547978  ORF Transcript_171002/g.547978 Transcript_171002/m.547978 type:complete len:206 (-) Transcript_171002:1149-1766(-)